MNTNSRRDRGRALNGSCCAMAALGWILGLESRAAGAGLESWEATKPGWREETLLPHRAGWVTSLSASPEGIREAIADPRRREWEALGRAGGAMEQRSSLRGVFEMLSGDTGPFGTGALDSAGVTLDLSRGGSIALNPGMAGQEVPLWLRNDGAALEIGGLDLKIGITGGSLPAPAITGVNLRAGDLFTPANSVQGGDTLNTPQTQFWSVSVNDPLAPGALPGGGALTRVGTLTLSTVGVSAGQWSLSLFGNETALLGPFGDSVGMALVGGTLTVVPETGGMPLVTGAVLAAWGFGRRAVSGRRPRDSREPSGV